MLDAEYYRYVNQVFQNLADFFLQTSRESDEIWQGKRIPSLNRREKTSEAPLFTLWWRRFSMKNLVWSMNGVSELKIFS